MSCLILTPEIRELAIPLKEEFIKKGYITE